MAWLRFSGPGDSPSNPLKLEDALSGAGEVASNRRKPLKVQRSRQVHGGALEPRVLRHVAQLLLQEAGSIPSTGRVFLLGLQLSPVANRYLH